MFSDFRPKKVAIWNVRILDHWTSMVETEIDYESLGGNESLSTNAYAGAIAGVFEHIMVYPIDVVKTRMQSIRPSSTPVTANPFAEAAKIQRAEGWRSLVRGSPAVLLGCGPAHAFQYVVFALGFEPFLKNRKMCNRNQGSKSLVSI